MQQQEHSAQQPDYQALRARSRKTKKKILITLAFILGIIVLMAVTMVILQGIEEKKENEHKYNFDFYAPYDGDIMENEEYLGLDRQIAYCDDPSGYGVTQSVTDENRNEFDPAVLFLCDYIGAIIAGDSNAYNAMFAASYFETEQPQKDFSQQMLHNIKIIFQSEQKEGSDRILTYRVEYMIHRNDGSFRQDIGSDASRPQNIVLRVDIAQNTQIEQIITFHEK